MKKIIVMCALITSLSSHGRMIEIEKHCLHNGDIYAIVGEHQSCPDSDQAIPSHHVGHIHYKETHLCILTEIIRRYFED